MPPELPGDSFNVHRNQLDRWLHDIGWGLLLTMTGIIWILPQDRVPEGAWLLGVAAILLGVNVVRYFNHIRVSGLSIGLGIAAVVAVLARFWRSDLPLLAICFIVIGISLVLKPLLMRTA